MTTFDAGPNTDSIQVFAIEGLGIRGRFVRLGPALRAMINPHKLPGPVAKVMAETLALTATLASALKFDGLFTLQTQSDGPLSMLVADITSEGVMRGYARYDAPALSLYGKNVSFAKLAGAGHLAFTVDPGGDLDRYQGIVPLEGESLAACMHNYFRQSEQLETAIAVFSDIADPDAGVSAALMLQRMPETGGAGGKEIDEDDWRRAVALMSSVTSDEMLDESLSPMELLYRLFHEDGVRLFDPRPVQQGCRCSAEKVSNTLRSFPKDEIAEMADDGIVTVTCEFCKTDYRFHIDNLADLIGTD